VIAAFYTEMPRWTPPVPTLLEDHEEPARGLCDEASNNRIVRCLCKLFTGRRHAYYAQFKHWLRLWAWEEVAGGLEGPKENCAAAVHGQYQCDWQLLIFHQVRNVRL
jgi:hypothetical protein